jgi:ATP-dependent Clp protease protease subunit
MTNKSNTKKKKDELWAFDTNYVLNTHRQVFLYGEITDNVAATIKKQLIAHDIVSGLPISLWITSPGGSCSAGLSIIEVIKKIESPVITIISGEVCSMAALISVCGRVKWAFSTSIWMQHPMSSGQADYLPFIKDRTAFLARYNDILMKILKENTNLTDKDYKKIEGGELWLNSQEMLEKKVIDKII